MSLIIILKIHKILWILDNFADLKVLLIIRNKLMFILVIFFHKEFIINIESIIIHNLKNFSFIHLPYN